MKLHDANVFIPSDGRDIIFFDPELEDGTWIHGFYEHDTINGRGFCSLGHGAHPRVTCWFEAPAIPELRLVPPPAIGGTSDA